MCPKLLLQSIVIGGLGSPTFERSTAALDKAYTLFERSFEEECFEPFDAVSDGEQGPEITVSNCYLMSHKDAPLKMDSTNLGTDLDPQGIIKALIKKGDYFHREDNVVGHYICSGGKDGNRMYKLYVWHDL